MEAKTINSERVWHSPDGQRSIWRVELEGDDGKIYRLKTYSPHIAQRGFKGKVESYKNRFGERFVRQAPADKTAGAAKPKASYSRDDNAIRAQWAIGQAINLASVKIEKDSITLPIIEEYAKQLYETVSRVKGDKFSASDAAEAQKYIRAFTQAPASA